MLKNYFKTAWRNLRKNKLYSVINIAGLTLGLTIGSLILLWVQDELSYDAFHQHASNIYKLEISGGTGTSKQIFTLGVAPIGPLAKQEIPHPHGCCRSGDSGEICIDCDHGDAQVGGA